mmetsp:Transcript_15411/g.58295  ORF Transcript_15411/g.58295 Transcript_15411/m.58295 type:complete len:213 (+) Transcript_15411:1086-1724(+)
MVRAGGVPPPAGPARAPQPRHHGYVGCRGRPRQHGARDQRDPPGGGRRPGALGGDPPGRGCCPSHPREHHCGVERAGAAAAHGPALRPPSEGVLGPVGGHPRRLWPRLAVGLRQRQLPGAGSESGQLRPALAPSGRSAPQRCRGRWLRAERQCHAPPHGFGVPYPRCGPRCGAGAGVLETDRPRAGKAPHRRRRRPGPWRRCWPPHPHASLA